MTREIQGSNLQPMVRDKELISKFSESADVQLMLPKVCISPYWKNTSNSSENTVMMPQPDSMEKRKTSPLEVPRISGPAAEEETSSLAIQAQQNGENISSNVPEENDRTEPVSESNLNNNLQHKMKQKPRKMVQDYHYLQSIAYKWSKLRSTTVAKFKVNEPPTDQLKRKRGRPRKHIQDPTAASKSTNMFDSSTQAASLSLKRTLESHANLQHTGDSPCVQKLVDDQAIAEFVVETLKFGDPESKAKSLSTPKNVVLRNYPLRKLSSASSRGTFLSRQKYFRRRKSIPDTYSKFATVRSKVGKTHGHPNGDCIFEISSGHPAKDHISSTIGTQGASPSDHSRDLPKEVSSFGSIMLKCTTPRKDIEKDGKCFTKEIHSCTQLQSELRKEKEEQSSHERFTLFGTDSNEKTCTPREPISSEKETSSYANEAIARTNVKGIQHSEKPESILLLQKRKRGRPPKQRIERTSQYVLSMHQKSRKHDQKKSNGHSSSEPQVNGGLHTHSKKGKEQRTVRDKSPENCVTVGDRSITAPLEENSEQIESLEKKLMHPVEEGSPIGCLTPPGSVDGVSSIFSDEHSTRVCGNGFQECPLFCSTGISSSSASNKEGNQCSERDVRIQNSPPSSRICATHVPASDGNVINESGRNSSKVGSFPSAMIPPEFQAPVGLSDIRIVKTVSLSEEQQIKSVLAPTSYGFTDSTQQKETLCTGGGQRKERENIFKTLQVGLSTRTMDFDQNGSQKGIGQFSNVNEFLEDGDIPRLEAYGGSTDNGPPWHSPTSGDLVGLPVLVKENCTDINVGEDEDEFEFETPSESELTSEEMFQPEIKSGEFDAPTGSASPSEKENAVTISMPEENDETHNPKENVSHNIPNILCVSSYEQGDGRSVSELAMTPEVNEKSNIVDNGLENGGHDYEDEFEFETPEEDITTINDGNTSTCKSPDNPNVLCGTQLPLQETRENASNERDVQPSEAKCNKETSRDIRDDKTEYLKLHSKIPVESSSGFKAIVDTCSDTQCNQLMVDASDCEPVTQLLKSTQESLSLVCGQDTCAEVETPDELPSNPVKNQGELTEEAESPENQSCDPKLRVDLENGATNINKSTDVTESAVENINRTLPTVYHEDSQNIPVVDKEPLEKKVFDVLMKSNDNTEEVADRFDGQVEKQVDYFKAHTGSMHSLSKSDEENKFECIGDTNADEFSLKRKDPKESRIPFSGGTIQESVDTLKEDGPITNETAHSNMLEILPNNLEMSNENQVIPSDVDEIAVENNQKDRVRPIYCPVWGDETKSGTPTGIFERDGITQENPTQTKYQDENNVTIHSEAGNKLKECDRQLSYVQSSETIESQSSPDDPKQHEVSAMEELAKESTNKQNRSDLHQQLDDSQDDSKQHEVSEMEEVAKETINEVNHSDSHQHLADSVETDGCPVESVENEEVFEGGETANVYVDISAADGTLDMLSVACEETIGEDKEDVMSLANAEDATIPYPLSDKEDLDSEMMQLQSDLPTQCLSTTTTSEGTSIPDTSKISVAKKDTIDINEQSSLVLKWAVKFKKKEKSKNRCKIPHARYGRRSSSHKKSLRHKKKSRHHKHRPMPASHGNLQKKAEVSDEPLQPSDVTQKTETFLPPQQTPEQHDVIKTNDGNTSDVSPSLPDVYCMNECDSKTEAECSEINEKEMTDRDNSSRATESQPTDFSDGTSTLNNTNSTSDNDQEVIEVSSTTIVKGKDDKPDNAGDNGLSPLLTASQQTPINTDLGFVKPSKIPEKTSFFGTSRKKKAQHATVRANPYQLYPTGVPPSFRHIAPKQIMKPNLQLIRLIRPPFQTESGACHELRKHLLRNRRKSADTEVCQTEQQHIMTPTNRAVLVFENSEQILGTQESTLDESLHEKVSGSIHGIVDNISKASQLLQSGPPVGQRYVTSPDPSILQRTESRERQHPHLSSQGRVLPHSWPVGGFPSIIHATQRPLPSDEGQNMCIGPERRTQPILAHEDLSLPPQPGNHCGTNIAFDVPVYTATGQKEQLLAVYPGNKVIPVPESQFPLRQSLKPKTTGRTSSSGAATSIPSQITQDRALDLLKQLHCETDDLKKQLLFKELQEIYNIPASTNNSQQASQAWQMKQNRQHTNTMHNQHGPAIRAPALRVDESNGESSSHHPFVDQVIQEKASRHSSPRIQVVTSITPHMQDNGKIVCVDRLHSSRNSTPQSEEKSSDSPHSIDGRANMLIRTSHSPSSQKNTLVPTDNRVQVLRRNSQSPGNSLSGHSDILQATKSGHESIPSDNPECLSNDSRESHSAEEDKPLDLTCKGNKKQIRETDTAKVPLDLSISPITQETVHHLSKGDCQKKGPQEHETVESKSFSKSCSSSATAVYCEGGPVRELGRQLYQLGQHPHGKAGSSQRSAHGVLNLRNVHKENTATIESVRQAQLVQRSDSESIQHELMKVGRGMGLSSGTASTTAYQDRVEDPIPFIELVRGRIDHEQHGVQVSRIVNPTPVARVNERGFAQSGSNVLVPSSSQSPNKIKTPPSVNIQGQTSLPYMKGYKRISPDLGGVVKVVTENDKGISMSSNSDQIEMSEAYQNTVSSISTDSTAAITSKSQVSSESSEEEVTLASSNDPSCSDGIQKVDQQTENQENSETAHARSTSTSFISQCPKKRFRMAHEASLAAESDDVLSSNPLNQSKVHAVSTIIEDSRDSIQPVPVRRGRGRPRGSKKIVSEDHSDPAPLQQCTFCEFKSSSKHTIRVHQKKEHFAKYMTKFKMKSDGTLQEGDNTRLTKKDEVTTATSSAGESQSSTTSEGKGVSYVEGKEIEQSEHQWSFTCKLCSFSQSIPRLLVVHINKKHSRDLSSGQCPFHRCTRRFTAERELKEHLSDHWNVKPYSCRICGLRYQVETSLKAHIERHKQELPNLCENIYFYMAKWNIKASLYEPVYPYTNWQQYEQQY